jgi:cystathionine beta-lyase/cystathionine gamma-synthase
MLTFRGLDTYQERSSEVNNEGAKKIQKTLRAHQQSKIEKSEAQEKPRSFVEAATAGKYGGIKSRDG